MVELDALFTAGGTAKWGKPVPIGANLTTQTYEAWVGVRLRIKGRPDAYLTCFITGLDDATPDGRVPRGTGAIEMIDNDEDKLWAKIEWYTEGAADKGRLTLNSGTGKWRDAAGQFPVDLFLSPNANHWSETQLVGFWEAAGTIKLG